MFCTLFLKLRSCQSTWWTNSLFSIPFQNWWVSFFALLLKGPFQPTVADKVDVKYHLLRREPPPFYHFLSKDKCHAAECKFYGFGIPLLPTAEWQFRIIKYQSYQINQNHMKSNSRVYHPAPSILHLFSNLTLAMSLMCRARHSRDKKSDFVSVHFHSLGRCVSLVLVCWNI